MNLLRTTLSIIAATVLTACGGNQQKHNRLIATADHYAIDTVAVAPEDTVVSPAADEVLRRYPELYHATKQARKAYNAWAEQQLMAELDVQTEIMDVGPMVDQALTSIGADDTAEMPWPDLTAADSLYLQMTGRAATVEKKSDIGRTRRAWLIYAEQLQHIVKTLPQECRQDFVKTVDERAKQYINLLKQTLEKL